MIQLNDKESYLLNPTRIHAVYKTQERTIRAIPAKHWWQSAGFELENGAARICVAMEGNQLQVLTYDAKELRDGDYELIKRACELEASTKSNR